MPRYLTGSTYGAGPTRNREGRGPHFARFCVIGVLFAFCVPMAALAEPLNLFDPRPREVSVVFENSPRDFPARVNKQYTQEFRAFVEPGLRESEVRVVIPAHTVEAHLLGEQKPVRESFSDFVWTFDVETGHVISAHLTGRVRPKISWGFITTETQADIEVEMGTGRIGGFKRPLRVLGQLVFRYCTAVEDKNCQLVESAPLDPKTGYVNAIGQVWVRSMFVDLWNFSPMGEAIFRELDPVVPAVETYLGAESGLEFSRPVGLAGLPVARESTILGDNWPPESN